MSVSTHDFSAYYNALLLRLVMRMVGAHETFEKPGLVQTPRIKEGPLKHQKNASYPHILENAPSFPTSSRESYDFRQQRNMLVGTRKGTDTSSV